MKIHRDRRSDAAGRQRTARRFAVGRGMNRCEHPPDVRSRAGGAATCSWLAASGCSTGLPGPAFTALLASRFLRPITATSEPKCRS